MLPSILHVCVTPLVESGVQPFVRLFYHCCILFAVLLPLDVIFSNHIITQESKSKIKKPNMWQKNLGLLRKWYRVLPPISPQTRFYLQPWHTHSTPLPFNCNPSLPHPHSHLGRHFVIFSPAATLLLCSCLHENSFPLNRPLTDFLTCSLDVNTGKPFYYNKVSFCHLSFVSLSAPAVFSLSHALFLSFPLSLSPLPLFFSFGSSPFQFGRRRK